MRRDVARPIEILQLEELHLYTGSNKHTSTQMTAIKGVMEKCNDLV